MLVPLLPTYICRDEDSGPVVSMSFIMGVKSLVKARVV